MISSTPFSDSFDAFDADDPLTWDTLPIDSVELSADQIAAAARLAEAIATDIATDRESSQTRADWSAVDVAADPEADRQWRAYLLALATTGFVSWLGDRAPDLDTSEIQPLTLERLRHCWRSSPHADAVAPLQVGEFRVCVLAMGSLTDRVVSVPTAVFDEAEATAHFYVLVEVLEEQHQARVYGYFRHDQYNGRQPQAPTDSPAAAPIQNKDFYTVPLNHFMPEANNLLLDFRALDADAIPLPKSQAPSAQASLDSLLNQLQSVAERSLNAAAWVHDQLDEVAADLSWSLMPELVPVTTGLRSGAIANGDFVTEDAIVDVFQDLQAAGVDMPMSVRGAYRDLHWGQAAVRLHALVWESLDSDLDPEWTLLVVVSALLNHTLPAGLTLVVRDDQDILAQRGVLGDDDDRSLYAQVMGSQDEMFWVTIDFGNGAIATLPPFAFQP